MLLLSGVDSIDAQVSDKNYLYYHISAKDGLADNLVTCFYQDSRGIMWIGTAQGLNSFDGSEIYTWGQGPNQLCDKRVMSICEDHHKNLWIATLNGLTSLNITTKKTEAYLFPGFSNYIRRAICHGDSLWMATNDGILLYDIKHKTSAHYSNNNEKTINSKYYFDNDINTIFIDSKNRFWIGSTNGLWLFDVKQHTFVPFTDPPGSVYDGMVNAIHEDKTGKLWAGCWSTGLKQILPDAHSIKLLPKLLNAPYHVVSIAEGIDDNKKLCLWTSGNLCKFIPSESRFENYLLQPVAPAASLDAACLYVSRDNLLWIATAKGVYILDPARQLFKHTFINSQNNITAQGAGLYDEHGKLWLGGDNNCMLQVYDTRDFRMIKDYSLIIKKKGEPYSSMAIMNIHSYNHNQLLLSTTIGVLSIDTISGKLNTLCASITDSLSRSTSFFDNTYADKDRLWCFPWRRGIWEYNASLKKFEPVKITLPDNKGHSKGMNIVTAVPDAYGHLWLADMDYGVVKYDIKSHKLQRVINKDIPDYCRVTNISYMDGKLWLIINNKIISMDPKTNTYNDWSVPENMSKNVYDFIDDGGENLWLITGNGLLVFNVYNHTFNQYTEQDGILNDDLNGTLHLLQNGCMVYAGDNYITHFKPGMLLHSQQKKEILLTRVLANDSDIVLRLHKKLTIPASTEKITFKWAFINYTNPLQNRYYNKLDGVDKNWNYAGTKGSVEYNGLQPGNYTFRYRAVTSDGLSYTEKTLKFTVLPTFWQSWWFFTFLILVAGSCVMLIIRLVRYQERKKAAINLQLSELEMKALRAQMNPHFIFNALNSIQECIITKNTNAAYNYLSNFSKLVRMILENSEKQFISLADEIETLKLYLSLEKLRFDETFEHEVKTNPKIDTSFIHVPAMILQPYAENALWHGLIHKKGKKNICISFEQQAGYLKCIIEDNGIGRKAAMEMQSNTNKAKKRSMGMAITQERLQLLEERASVTINDLLNDDGEPSGTRVIIMMPLEF